MKKASKLAEKAVRFADGRASIWEPEISAYLSEIEKMQKEQARSHRFTALVQKLLHVEPGFIDSWCAGIESSVKVREKDRILRGEVDNLFGNIIIEFEHALPKNRSEAEEQLKRYTAILWSKEPPSRRTPYLCIAADGVRFVAYTPLPANPEAQGISPDDVTLVVLEECDWKKLNAEEIFYWLDRYFLRKEILHPTGESIVKDFGLKSHAFQAASHDLLSLWNTVKSESSFGVVYESWGSYLRIVYGSDIGEDALFIRHT
ncbi:MAG: hypothetical protein Q8O92_02475, partial [Candidatus Latescibacter sp.]|nr:hypothetical protein [Candidatus Latescibacter sp.]